MGSLAVKYELELQNIQTTQNIENVIDVIVDDTKVGTLSDFMDGKDLDAGILKAGTNSAAKAITLKMQEGAGNEYQGATAEFDILLKATQAPVEEDGFGNPDYDAQAPLDFIPVDTADGFIQAVESSSDTEVVQLTGDLSIDQNIPQSRSGKTHIDLNGFTLTVEKQIDNLSGMELADGSVSIQNGSIRIPNGVGVAPSAIRVIENGRLELEKVNLTVTQASAIIVANQASVQIRDSVITADGYCVSTNATELPSAVRIDMENTTLNAPLNTTSTGVLLNVPGTLTMTGCTVNSKWQSVIVRGGTATLTNCVLNNMLEDDGTDYTKPDYKENVNWGSGNDVPNAALVVGNRDESAYQYPAECTLINTEIHVADGFTTVYAYGNTGEGCGATVRYDHASKMKIGTIKIGGGNAAAEEI